MSLKTFHIAFVAVCFVLALGFGFWAIRHYRASHDVVALVCGVGSLVGAGVSIVYGRWFLKKLAGVSYL